GSEMQWVDGQCVVTHALPREQVAAIFTDKRSYLATYKERAQPKIAAMKAALPHGQVNILAELKAWFEPLMAIGYLTRVGINGRILLQLGEHDIVLDFQNREVRPSTGEDWEFRFKVAPELIEWLIVTHQVDWINTLFLSCRFEAERKGAYNEYVYNFFKCL